VQIGVGYAHHPKAHPGLYGSGGHVQSRDQSTARRICTPRRPACSRLALHSVGSESIRGDVARHRLAGVLGPGRSGTTSLQGSSWRNFRSGVDYRIAPAVAVSPMIGADSRRSFGVASWGHRAISNILPIRE